MTIGGSCLCGRFAFEVEGPFSQMSHCHCTICRKAHGSGFATYVSAGSLRFTAGSGEQGSYPSSPGLSRAFCPSCGSKVPGPDASGGTFVAAGLLDGDPGVRPQAHIYAADRAPWEELSDGIAIFEGAPPGYPDPGLETPSRPEGAREGRIAGSCLCGDVAWEQQTAPEIMGHCHCSRCRKLRGAAYSTQLFVPHAEFDWIRGREQVVEYQLPGAAFFGNSFCERCAAPVPRDVPGAPMIMIPAGPLDDDPIGRPSAHIYVASKAPWYEIPDSLPRFDEMPPGEGDEP